MERSRGKDVRSLGIELGTSRTESWALTNLDFLKVRFCGSPVGRKTDFSHLQRAIFYRPDFRSAVCPGVWQQ